MHIAYAYTYLYVQSQSYNYYLFSKFKYPWVMESSWQIHLHFKLMTSFIFHSTLNGYLISNGLFNFNYITSGIDGNLDYIYFFLYDEEKLELNFFSSTFHCRKQLLQKGFEVWIQKYCFILPIVFLFFLKKVKSCCMKSFCYVITYKF